MAFEGIVLEIGLPSMGITGGFSPRFGVIWLSR